MMGTPSASSAAPFGYADVKARAAPRRRPAPGTIRFLPVSYLNLLAGLITLGILAIAGQALWADRLTTWQEAERSSRNIVTALARDLTHDLNLLDLSLKGVVEGLQYPGLQALAPELQHRVLFDRSVTASLLASLLALNETGDAVADSSAAAVPRPANYADRDYFQVHKDDPGVGMYLSRPYKSRRRNGEFSIATSRRVSHPDGRFAGVVVSGIAMTSLQGLFANLNLGRQGVLSLFRADGILLTRQPFDENLVGRDLGGSPNVQRALKERSGSFEATSQLDGVRRLVTFERLNGHPLLLTVSVAVDDVFAAWTERALVLGLVTLALCVAVVALTVLFQRQLRLQAETEAELARLATTDALTGLPNRRAFDEAFDREWRQAIRSGSPISLLYVDGDFFKSFNDQYGHGSGDDLLSLIGRTIGESVRRPRDIAARYGGEEFVVLLPETDLAGAARIGENIRQALAARAIAHTGNPHRVATVSIGAASARPSSGAARDDLVKASDAALYVAKASGRNRVHAAGAQDATLEPAAAAT